MMFTADKVLEDARPKLLAVIGHYLSAGHDKMSAYDRAARDVGRSPAWVRRIIGRRDQATVAAHDWLNLTALCVRLEASTARKEADAAAIRAEIVACRETSEGRVGRGESHGGPDLGQVSPVVDEGAE